MSADGQPPAGAERSGAPRLFFIRHGETDWNAEGRLQGQRDVPINARGREQAVEAAHRLREVRPNPGALPWIVSPLGRTRETAELARVALGLEPTSYVMEERLREISFGRWEGFTWREIRKTEPEAARDRERGKWTLVPPGGESYVMLVERVRPWVDEIMGDSVIVAHGGVARALMHIMAGVPGVQASAAEIWQGRVLVFEKSRFFWV